MIEWMQKHKKWLVITIWVSAIAFVGAGFVGWGSYDFGKSGSAIAEVGDVQISGEEFNREYGRLYNTFAQMSPDFDQAKAKEMGLPRQALQSLLDTAYIQNYAIQSGIMVSQKEIAEQISKMEPFLVDGVFNKERYLKLLQQNGYKPQSFEKMIKNEILVKKITDMLDPSLTDLEKKAITAPLNIADKVSIAIIQKNSIDPNPDENETEAYWAEHKNMFLSDPAYRLQAVIVKYDDVNVTEDEMQKEYDKDRTKYTDENGTVLPYEKIKIVLEDNIKKEKAEKEVLLNYIALKKGEAKEPLDIIITDQNNSYGETVIEELQKTDVGEAVKFVPIPDGLMSFIYKESIEPKPLPYETVKDEVRKALIDEIKDKELIAQAEAKLQDFSGRNLGFLKRGDIAKIPGLQESEAAEFLTKLFEKSKSKGIVYLTEKAIVYNILEQKLLEDGDTGSEAQFLVDSIKKLKYFLIEEELLKKLKKLYDQKIYVKFE